MWVTGSAAVLSTMAAIVDHGDASSQWIGIVGDPPVNTIGIGGATEWILRPHPGLAVGPDVAAGVPELALARPTVNVKGAEAVIINLFISYIILLSQTYITIHNRCKSNKEA